MNKNHVLLSVMFVGCISSFAAEIIPEWSVNKWGKITGPSCSMEIIFRGKPWKDTTEIKSSTLSFKKGFPVFEDGKFKIEGKLDTAGSPNDFNYNFSVKKISDNSFDVICRAESQKPVDMNSAALELSLKNSDLFNKKIISQKREIVLPETFKTMRVYKSENEGVLEIPCLNGKLVISGMNGFSILDSRAFQKNIFLFRLYMTPGSGNHKSYSGKFNIKLLPHKSVSIDISGHCNVGFADNIPNDKKGGWTDEGRQNDLSCIKSGKLTCSGLKFNIIDPQKNNGRSCVILSGKKEKAHYPREVKMDGSGENFRYLYMLHAAAYPPKKDVQLGLIKARYSDGTEQDIKVVNGVDVGNWWTPEKMKNGAVAWKSLNNSSLVGLYLSKFALENKELENIELICASPSLWMIVAIEGSDCNIDLSKVSPMVRTVFGKGKGWGALQEKAPQITKDGILDFSFLNQHKPAGKFGYMIVKDGHLAFEKAPDKCARFYGFNIAHNVNCMDKEKSDYLASFAMKMGYNAIRLAHFERMIQDKNGRSSLEFDAVQLDKLDYLFAKMKEAGIYIAMDMYHSRNVKDGEIPGYDEKLKDLQVYKALVQVHPPAMDNWKAFCKKFLLRKNPYTGLRWIDDPALMSINVLNEDWLPLLWNKTPRLKEITMKRFDEWLKENNIRYKNDSERQLIFEGFLIERQSKAYKEMADYLKALGVKCVMSDGNNRTRLAFSFHRNILDFIEIHAYWDHPRFPGKKWGCPLLSQNLPSINLAAAWARSFSPVRIVGKPFMVTEFNFCGPNSFRAESGPVAGGYAALQDWDALFIHCLLNNEKQLMKPSPLGIFNVINDPVRLLSEKIGMLLFLRRDAKSAEKTIPYILTEGYFKNGEGRNCGERHPYEYSLLALIAKVGTLIDNNAVNVNGRFDACVGRSLKAPKGFSGDKYFDDGKNLIKRMLDAGILDPKRVNIKNGEYISETEEIALLSNKGLLKIVTPKTEAFVLSEKESLAGYFMRAVNKKGFVVICASAMDGEPLIDSKRILLIFLSDAKNTNMTFKTQNMQLMEKNGTLPILIKKACADIDLAVKGNAKIWGCDISGKRIEEVPFKQKENGILFTAQTVKDGKPGFMVYEIVSER